MLFKVMLHIQAIFDHVSDRESIYLSIYKYIDIYIYVCIIFKVFLLCILTQYDKETDL